MKERKDRVDDALAATRAAVEEGYVPGGGVALVRAVSKLDGLKSEEDDERLGIRLVARAATAPHRRDRQECRPGAEEVVVEKVRTLERRPWLRRPGRALHGSRSGRSIIDPLKVVRTALENAASIAGMMLTTEAAITECPRGAAPAPPEAAWVEWAAWAAWAAWVASRWAEAPSRALKGALPTTSDRVCARRRPRLAYFHKTHSGLGAIVTLRVTMPRMELRVIGCHGGRLPSTAPARSFSTTSWRSMQVR